MEQQYTHHHVRNAHHIGLITGTLIGSFTITILIAISAVVANPSYLLRPYELMTAVTLKTESQNPIELGAASQEVQDQVKNQDTNIGAGAASLLPLEDR